MNIGLICYDDYANFGYNIVESLKVVGINAKGFKKVKHPFNYDKQLEVVDSFNLTGFDLVINCHSYPEVLHKNTIPFHTGTTYRQKSGYYNSIFNSSPFSLIALPEFQFLTDNFKYVVSAIDTEDLQPVYKKDKERTIFGHYPSNEQVKGTNEIVNAMNGFNFKYSGEKLPYHLHIERLKGIDVCVELLNPSQDGKPYGSFGLTALEAAALGKIVITQNLNDNGLYQDNYDIPLLNFVKDIEDLKKICLNLDNYNDTHIIGQQELTRKWVENNHSFKATGERLKRIFNGL